MSSDDRKPGCCSAFGLVLIGAIFGYYYAGVACNPNSGPTNPTRVEDLVPSSAATYFDTFRVTAYCPCARCCAPYSDGTTASGKLVTANGGRFVAAPKSYPFGTIMEIPGYGSVPVLDRGGAIKGKRLDVFFPTHQEALNWGVKNLRVSYHNTKGATNGY